MLSRWPIVIKPPRPAGAGESAFIFREFMQVRNAPTLLCRLTDLWVLMIGAALLGSYFLGLGHVS